MHPLIKVCLELQKLSEVMERVGLSQQTRDSLLLHREYLEQWYDELVASCQSVEFLVGFCMGHNNKVYMIWVWPLSASWSKYYWLDDGTWSNPLDA